MLSLCLFVAAMAVPDATAAGQITAASRQILIEALERMIETGEPHHDSHDQGEILQRAVMAAIAQHDAEVELLATRAAVRVSARIVRPVIAVTDTVPLGLSARFALKLPRQVRYDADVIASLDGGDTIHLGRIAADEETFELAKALPWTARVPGAHHLRLRVLLTYEGDAAPPPEYRDLPELVFAVYDSERESFADARVFLFSPAGVSAQLLDNRLPDMPLALWLNSLLVARGGEPIHEYSWRSFYCDERTREPWLPYRRLDVCSVFLFQLGDALGQIWIRTGRVELAETAVQWLAGTPAVEAIRFIRPVPSETYDLAHLENILDTVPDQWARADVSIKPDDIVITRNQRRPNAAHVSVTIRNNGDTDLYAVYVQFFGGDFEQPSARFFLRDIPRRDAVQIEADVTYPRGYGIAVVQLMPGLTDYSPWIDGPAEDPTPEDNAAFRAINPQRAPAGYVKAIQARCGPRCSGY
jgi:hypothetical protein